jgi:hypothetical protein
MNKRRVLLYGRSMILGAVEASLRRYAHLELISLAPPFPAAQELGALAPDVIIFDLEAAHPESALSLLEARPSLLLIGIDPDSDRMLVWSGQRSRALAMQDLVQVINGLPPASGPAAPRWPHLDRLRHSISAPATWPRIPTRAQKLALAGAAIGLSAVLFLVWSLANPTQPVASGPTPPPPLSGTALGDGAAPDMWLALAAGLVLAGVLIGLWLRCGGRNNARRS